MTQSQLDAAPAADSGQTGGARIGTRPGPAQKVWALGRNLWRRLTSMRTALVLLMLLAVAAIPGALLPQRDLNEAKVAEYIASHGLWGRILDTLQFYDVFASYWFVAIYVLLFVSLVGCILPRIRDHIRNVRSQPVPLPRRLSRFPFYAEITRDEEPAEVARLVERKLRTWRVRAEPNPERGTFGYSAEKGYNHEWGSLLFHSMIVVLLVVIAIGRFQHYEGQRIVIVGSGAYSEFCTTSVSNFDSFRAGAMVDGTDITPLCVNVDSFDADYLSTGQAEMFYAHLRYESLVPGQEETGEKQIRVNDPLRIDGNRVYLQGHGFAPTFTVTYPNGESRTKTVQFRPDDTTTMLSSGAMRFDAPADLYPDLQERRQHQVALQGLFAPTAAFHGDSSSLLQSTFPAMQSPAVAIDIYQGDTGLDAGTPQNLFALDEQAIAAGLINKAKLTDGTPARVNLEPGQTATLADGTEIRFDGAEQFVNLQVSYDPTQNWVLVVAVLMIIGLLMSLFIPRRRVWVKVSQDLSGSAGTIIELAGLTRTDRSSWGAEFRRNMTSLSEDDLPARAPSKTVQGEERARH